MAQVILIKRGQAINIDSANLQEGELALGFSQDKSTVVLYVGNGTATPIQVNAGAIASALAEAKTYADTQIAGLIDGAPEAYDTLKEISQYISTHESEYEALEALVSGKISAPATAGTAGQVLKIGADGKPYWAADENTTYSNATQSAAGLMSAEDKTKVDSMDDALSGKVDKVSGKGLSTEDYTTVEKTKLSNISPNSGDTQTASAAEKSAWNAKLGPSSIIDGGTF